MDVVRGSSSSSSSSRSAATDLADAFAAAEANILKSIAELEVKAELLGPDQFECKALSDEAGRIVSRWRNTASVAFQGLNDVEKEIENELRIHADMERVLQDKESKLAKMWSDSKVIKTAISILDGDEVMNPDVN